MGIIGHIIAVLLIYYAGLLTAAIFSANGNDKPKKGNQNDNS